MADAEAWLAGTSRSGRTPSRGRSSRLAVQPPPVRGETVPSRGRDRRAVSARAPGRGSRTARYLAAPAGASPVERHLLAMHGGGGARRSWPFALGPSHVPFYYEPAHQGPHRPCPRGVARHQGRRLRHPPRFRRAAARRGHRKHCQRDEVARPAGMVGHFNHLSASCRIAGSRPRGGDPADNDPAGRQAAIRAAQRLRREGRRVRFVQPGPCNDFNDLLLLRRRCHAA